MAIFWRRHYEGCACRALSAAANKFVCGSNLDKNNRKSQCMPNRVCDQLCRISQLSGHQMFMLIHWKINMNALPMKYKLILYPPESIAFHALRLLWLKSKANNRTKKKSLNFYLSLFLNGHKYNYLLIFLIFRLRQLVETYNEKTALNRFHR